MYIEVPYCASDTTGVDTVVVNRSPLVWSFDPSTDLPVAGTLATPTATFFRNYVEPQSFPQRQYMLPGEIYSVPTHTVSWWPDYTLTAEWVGLSEAFKQISEFGPQAYADAISRRGLPGRAAYECGKSAASAIGSVAQITDETVYLDKIKAGVQTSTAGAKCAKLLVELEKAEAQKTGKVPAAVSAWEIRTNRWTSANQFMDDLLKGLKYVINFAK